MSIAWLVGSLVGVTWWSMVLVMFVALLIGRWELLGDHGIQVPTMVLLSLITVNGTDTEFTSLTIVETVLGGVVGVAVNAVVLAPMHLEEPRDALRDLTSRVQDLLGDIAAGIREGWDADRARRWYHHATDLGDRVPEVLQAVETGRESTRFNWRHRLRPARIDWDGYVRTVEAVRRAQWQVAGIARTLVDAADEADRHPAPSARWLRSYADVLDEVGAAISHFGVWADESREAVERARGPRARGARRDERAGAPHAARRPARVAGLRRPRARGASGWPASCARATRTPRCPPTPARSGRRSPRACPRWPSSSSRCRRVGEQLPRIIERVSALGQPAAGTTAPATGRSPPSGADVGGPARPS